MFKKGFSLFIIGIISLLAFSLTKADYLDSSFWASNPTDNQIETALFAIDSSYTNNRTGYSSACSISSVVHLSGGTDILPASLASNTIYVLDAGTYTTTYTIDLANCSAVVGSGDVIFQSTGTMTRILMGSGIQNLVLDNLSFDGKALHEVTPNDYGLEILNNSHNITLNSLDIFNAKYGVVLRNTQYLDIYNSKSHNNTVDGFYLQGMYKTNIYKSEAYNNLGTNGNNDGGIFIYLSSGVLVENLVSYNNLNNGLVFNSSSASIVDGLISYNNTGYGVRYHYTTATTMMNSNIYNNTNGFYPWRSSNNLIYNCNVFNNNNGLMIGYYSNNSFSNLNVFNNIKGIAAWGDTNDVFDNISLFNNDYGLRIEDSLDNNLFNNIRGYNNLTGINFDYYWNITKAAPSLGNKYYGTLTLFNNIFNDGRGIDSKTSTGLIISGTAYDGVSFFVAGEDGYFSGLGRTNGIIDTTPIFSNDWIIEPINASGISLFDGMPSNKIGQNTGWTATSDINLIYGKSISKQTRPIYYNGTEYAFSDFPWNYAVYVGKTWDSDFYFIDKEYITGTDVSSFVTDANTFVGEDTLDVGLFVDSSFPKDVVLQSTGTTKIETFIDSGVYFKQTNGITNYEGTLSAPIELNKDTASELQGQYITSVVHIGSFTDTIRFKDGSGNDTGVIVRIPVPGLTIGSPMTIFYSSDETTWNTLTTSNVIDISGTPYVEFNTTHFTYFAVSGGTGSFVINNDDATTSTSGVTLAIDASGAQYMRFSNDGSNRSTWESYTTSKSRTISNTPGTKTVYAQFDINGDFTGDISTFDTIFLLDIQQGQLSLEILTGSSECVYGTSLYLGEQNVKLNEAYSFSGTFSGQRYCADYVGNSDGWVFTIGVSDLDNSNGGIISGSNLSISHGGAITQGDSACTGYDGATSEFYTTPYTLIEKAIDSNKICKVTLDSVDIEINVPANQAPGSYAGTLTIYVPNF